MGQEITYCKCEKGPSHYNELASWVCLESGCLNNLLLCNICFYENHKNHNVIPLILVMKGLKEQIQPKVDMLKNIGNNNDQQNLITVLEKSKSETHDHLDDTLQKIITIKHNTTQYYDKFLEEITQSIPSVDILTNVVSSLKDSLKNHQDLQKSIQMLLPYSDFLNEKVEKSIQFNPEVLVGCCSAKLHDFQQDVESANKAVNDIILKLQAKLLEKINISTQNQCFALQFQDLHDKDVEYSKNFKCVTRKTDFFYKMCFLNKEIKPQSTVNFSFKVTNPMGWLAVGIFYKKKAIESGYNFFYSTNNHGGYLISSNGGSWSSSSPDDNNSIKAFTFKAGDVIKCDFIGPEKKLNFSLNSETYSLNLEYLENDHIFPVAISYYKDSVVEIL